MISSSKGGLERGNGKKTHYLPANASVSLVPSFQPYKEKVPPALIRQGFLAALGFSGLKDGQDCLIRRI